MALTSSLIESIPTCSNKSSYTRSRRRGGGGGGAGHLRGRPPPRHRSPPQEKRVGTDAAPRTMSSGAPSSVASAGTSVAAFLEPTAASIVVPSSAAPPGTSLAVSPEWAAAPVGASFNAAANPLVAAGSSAPLPPQGSFEKLPLLC